MGRSEGSIASLGSPRLAGAAEVSLTWRSSHCRPGGALGFEQKHAARPAKYPSGSQRCICAPVSFCQRFTGAVREAKSRTAPPMTTASCRRAAFRSSASDRREAQEPRRCKSILWADSLALSSLEVRTDDRTSIGCIASVTFLRRKSASVGSVPRSFTIFAADAMLDFSAYWSNRSHAHRRDLMR